VDGMGKQEPWVELRGVVPEAGKDYERLEIEVLKTMIVGKLDVINRKVIP
jgi:hypothetical protein